MGYTIGQISNILLKADRTMYKIGQIAYDDMFSEDSESLDYERDIIFIYKKAVEYADNFFIGTEKLDKTVERLATKIAVYDYGILTAIYNDVASFNTNVLQVGSVLNDLYDVTITNILDNQLLRYNAATGQWINVGPGAAVRNSQSFVATAGQTTFTTAYPFDLGLYDIYLNGVKLNSNSYTTLGEYTFILNDAAVVDDIIDITIYDPITGMVNPVNTLAELDDVNLGPLVNNQVLYYNSTTGLWENKIMNSALWGNITGTLSNQTDLQNALNTKYNNPTGTTSQYLRGDGTLATFPTITSGTVTSVGLTMPSAFSVANSPVTSSGTLAVTGAGTASQYIRGDGQLANFPDNQGGGSSVNYYLNGSVTQGTFGGVTYYEMSKTPILGAGTNFTRTNAQGNGYIASFITDAGDPSLLNIPAGNWNVEFYFQSSSLGGSPQFYGELYKVDASNNFTLLGSGSTNPEGITNGTTIDQYFTSIPVPQTSLLVTDRLAIRIFVIPAGRTITLHTENSNLCEVLTTLSTGLNALNGLTSQVQYFATGTSGTDFAISSATDTHTFNLPTASATNRGALSSVDWTTFNSKQNALTNPITGSAAAGQVAFFTGATTQAGNNNLFWDNTNGRLGVNLNTPQSELQVGAKVGSGANVYSFASTKFGVENGLTKLICSEVTGPSQTKDVLELVTGGQAAWGNTTNRIIFTGFDRGNAFNSGTLAFIGVFKPDGLNSLGSGNLIFGTAATGSATSTERARIFATGNFGIGTGATDSGQRLQVVGTGYFSDSVGIGTTSLTGYNLRISNNITGIVSPIPVFVDGTIQATATGTTQVFRSSPSVVASATISEIRHFSALQGTFGAGSTVSTQTGFFVHSGMTGATTDYGFYGDLAAATNVWNLYMNGTANNYLNGSLLIGSTTDSGEKLQVTGTMKVTGATNIVNTLSVGTTTGADLRINVGVGSGSIASPLNMDLTYLGYAGATRARIRAVDQSNNTTASYLSFWTNNSGGTLNENMRLDASGNLGLGVTPSAWSVVRGLQVGLTASLGGYAASTEGMFLSSNSFYNGGAFVYQVTGSATQYLQINGTHRWSYAASGTAGNAITFTQAMTLDASGNLLVGGTSVYGATITSYGSSTRSGGMGIRNSAGTIAGFYGTYAAGSGSGSTDILVESAGFMLFSAAGAERMRLTATNGNLHIGTFTADSGEKLQVTGTAKITGNMQVGSSAPTSITGYTSFAVGNATNGGNIDLFTGATRHASWNNTATETYFGTRSNTPLIFTTNATDVGRFFANGDFRVGIAGSVKFFVDATNNSVAIGTSTINASAITQIDSTTKGFLPPRMTTAQKNAIATPPPGLMVYDTTLNKLCVFTTAWETITSI